jgi:hypothetical protein
VVFDGRREVSQCGVLLPVSEEMKIMLGEAVKVQPFTGRLACFARPRCGNVNSAVFGDAVKRVKSSRHRLDAHQRFRFAEAIVDLPPFLSRYPIPVPIRAVVVVECDDVPIRKFDPPVGELEDHSPYDAIGLCDAVIDIDAKGWHSHYLLCRQSTKP